MKRATALFIGLAVFLGAAIDVLADDALKVAVPQRGAWDAGLTELGKRGGIFKKHGLDVEILYTQAGPESIQALIGGSIDIAVAAGVSAAVGTLPKARRFASSAARSSARPIYTGTSVPNRRSARSRTSTTRRSPFP